MQIQYLSSTKKLGQELPKGTPQKGFLQQWQMAKIEFGREKFYLLIELTTQFPILINALDVANAKDLVSVLKKRLTVAVPSDWFEKKILDQQIFAEVTAVRVEQILPIIIKIKKQIKANQRKLGEQAEELGDLERVLAEFIATDVLGKAETFKFGKYLSVEYGMPAKEARPGSKQIKYQRNFQLPQAWDGQLWVPVEEAPATVKKIINNNQLMIEGWLATSRDREEVKKFGRVILDIYLNQVLIAPYVRTVTNNLTDAVRFFRQALDLPELEELMPEEIQQVLVSFFRYLMQTGVIRQADYKRVRHDLDVFRESYYQKLNEEYGDEDEVRELLQSVLRMDDDAHVNYSNEAVIKLITDLLTKNEVYQTLKTKWQAGIGINKLVNQYLKRNY
ncbi:MAG TPA: hypothetical protein H9783_00765 [Candidatus Limosilactobacillus faecipullorum]|nr:hypothetical protein [Candidatus Limosilactobacillus faecipullorum]